MTTKRILATGAGLALTLGLGAGIAAAQTDPAPTRPPQAGAMHDSDMGTMHGQMRHEMPAQCDEMHVEHGTMTDDGMGMHGSTGNRTAAPEG